MQGNYPVYLLSNGISAKFMCMNKENLEMYKNLETNQTNLIKDDKDNWSLTDGTQWGRRVTPLFGVKTEKLIRWDIF